MSLAELMPLVNNLSQPDKAKLFEYLGAHIDREDPDDEPEAMVLDSLRRSLTLDQRRQQMAVAAMAAIEDYSIDRELTAFIALDGEDFYDEPSDTVNVASPISSSIGQSLIVPKKASR